MLFHYGLLQATEYSSLCYTVGPCLSISYVVCVYVNSKLLILPSPLSPLVNHKFVFYVCKSTYAL